MSARGLWWLLAGVLVATVVHADGVRVHAFLDRDHAQLGDTVTLNVEVDGARQASAPDVTALATDFDILGRSHNVRVERDHGTRRVQSLWAVQLRPRHAGKLVIPAFEIDGQRTQPLRLTVSKAAPDRGHGGPGDPVFIRVRPSTRTPYVGQQVVLTVRLFYAPDVASGSLKMPQANGVEVRELGKTSRYEAERGGRIYRVLEKHYAVIAGDAGSLRLAPVHFHGRVADPGSLADFFGQGGQPIQARSGPVQLEVQARPRTAAKGVWLPARKLSLGLSGWPSGDRIEVGQPLTLTLTVKATGLPFESLPKLRLPTIADTRVYPDRPEGHTDDDGPWLVGTRTRKFALVMRQPGEITIPAITLSWWNVQTGKPETARIPAHVLHVRAAAGAPRSAPAPPLVARAASTSAQPASAASVQAALSPPDSRGSTRLAPSGWLAWLALALWLATMLAAGAWWWHRRRRATRVAASSRPSARAHARARREAFLKAARAGDPAAQCEALLAWARCERPGLHHLGELAEALRSHAQADAVIELRRARYAPDARAPEGDRLVALFGKGLAWHEESRAEGTDGVLPPLYPP